MRGDNNLARGSAVRSGSIQYGHIGSSRESLPADASRRITSAEIGFDMEAMLYKVMLLADTPGAASPYASTSMDFPFAMVANETLATPSRCSSGTIVSARSTDRS